VAPLKLAFGSDLWRVANLFPRQNCRGPIEADHRRQLLNRRFDFHGRIAVAPLKHLNSRRLSSGNVISTAELPWPH